MENSESFKCRVIYDSVQYPVYHDAILLEKSDKNSVVLFTHPVIDAMRPCLNFLSGAECTTTCRVLNDCVMAYEEPNYENLNIGNKCLAQNEHTQLWNYSEIMEVRFAEKFLPEKSSLDDSENDSHQLIFNLRNLTNEQTFYTDITHIKPLDNTKIDSITPKSLIDKGLITTQENPNFTISKDHIDTSSFTNSKVIVCKNPENYNPVGYNLLMKMGFTPGKGLGKNEQGIQEPVKANASTSPLLNKKRRSLKLNNTNKNDSKKPVSLKLKGSTDFMFDFLNESINKNVTNVDNRISCKKNRLFPFYRDLDNPINDPEISFDKSILHKNLDKSSNTNYKYKGNDNRKSNKDKKVRTSHEIESSKKRKYIF